MAVAGTVSIDLEARVAHLESDMGRAAMTMDRRMKQIQSIVSTAGTAIASYFSVKVIVDWADSLIDAADAMTKFAQKTGISVGTLAAWSKEAEKAGVDTDTMSKALQSLAKNSDAALNGNKGAAAALQRVGLSLADLKKLNPEQQLAKIADTFARYADGPAKAAAAQAVFGKSGPTMIAWLNQGGKAMDEAKQKAEDLGYVLSDSSAKQASDFNDKLSDMKTAAQGVGQTILDELLPALNQLASDFLAWIKSPEWHDMLVRLSEGTSDFVQNVKVAFRAFMAAAIDLEVWIEKWQERLSDMWQEDTDKFVYYWDVAVNTVKRIWQAMVDGLAKTVGVIPGKLGDEWKAQLQQYSGSLGVVDDLTAKYNAAQEARQQAHQQRLADIDKKWAAEKLKYTNPEAPPMPDLPRPPGEGGKPSFPGGIDVEGVDKAQKALDSLANTVAGFYAKNLETGDKVQDQQASSLRQLAQVAGAAVDAGADVAKVQDLVAKGSEQIAIAAQKMRDEENRAFDDYVAQQREQLAYSKAEYELAAAAVGMSDKEIKNAQDRLNIERDLNKAIEEQIKLRDKGSIDTPELERREQALKQIAQERLDALDASNKQLADNQANYLLGAERAYKNFMDQAQDVATQTGQIVTDAFSGFVDTFADLLTKGKADFKSFAASVLTDLAKMELRVSMSKVLSSVIGGGGWGGVAMGGVFASAPGISSLSGGVYNEPTFFAKGANVLGEAGYEGVLPLARNSAGKLGVMAQGAGSGETNVSVVVNVDNSGAASTNTSSNDDQMRTMGNMIAAKVKEVITSEQRPGGILWRPAHG